MKPARIAPEREKEWISGLQKALRQGRIGFRCQARARGETEYHVTGAGATTGVARESFPVLEFVTTTKSSYWVAVVLRFGEKRGEPALTSTGLIVFEGTASDPRKKPLFRAEWHSWTTKDSAAQPHWHVYVPTEEAERALDTFVAVEANATFMQVKEAERLATNSAAMEFHFAMCTRWASRLVAPHRHELSMPAATFWIGECLTYCRTQLEGL
jgi:hypothetical protein